MARPLGESRLAGDRFAGRSACFALAVVDFFIHGVEIRVVVAAIVSHVAVADFDDAGCHAMHEMPVVAGEDDGSLVIDEGLGEPVDGVDVQVVTRFVENQDVVLAEQQSGQAKPCPFAPRQHGDPFLHRVAAKEQGPGDVEDRLDFSAGSGVVFQIVEDRLRLGQTGVDVLGIDADLTAIAPARFAGQRLERIDDRAQKRRLSLSIVSDDRRARAMFDFDVDAPGNLPLGIADRQVAAAQRRPLARLDHRRPNVGRWFVGVDIDELQLFELFAFRPGARGGARPGFVLVDEFLELLAFGQDGGIRPLFVLAALLLIFQKGFDRAREHRQASARQIERVSAGGREESSIVRDDQTGLLEVAQKMLEQNLRPQVEKVGRFVQQQQIRVVQQQGRQFHPGLPATGKLADRPFQIGPFELELPGHFAAPPVGLAAIAHQEFQRRLARQKRIVLAQISQPQLGMPDHFAHVQLFFADQHAEQRRLAGPIAADEADFHVVDDRGLGTIEQHLIAVTLMRILDLQQYSHRSAFSVSAQNRQVAC